MTITLLQPPPSPTALPATMVREYVGAGQADHRMTRVLAVPRAEPEGQWQAGEIAELLGDVTLVAACRQLARRTEGFLMRMSSRGCGGPRPRGRAVDGLVHLIFPVSVRLREAERDRWWKQ
ncbi:hypothetical protein [Streptomyces sp. NPDC058572]|uniref:hypothetical protein n=1 Tax=Streptomyces sp. NPDC058572 TaxID=3346546 RepID=UPI00365CCEBC